MQNLNYKDFKDQIKKSSTLKIERRIYVVGGILMVVAVWIIYFYSIVNYESFVIKKYMLTTSGVLIAGLAIIGMCGIIYNKRKQTRTKEEKAYFPKYWITKLLREGIIGLSLVIVIYCIIEAIK